MNESIESLYFDWLYSNVCDLEVHEPSLRYLKLLRALHRIEFVWVVQGDDNRAAEGEYLRYDFFSDLELPVDEEFMKQGCSVLEMLVAFSRRAAFETDDLPRDWFWIMMDNLELSDLNDAVNPDNNHIFQVIETFMFRTYDRHGKGGLFPMYHSKHDQREVEIWYQFSEYLLERNWA